MDVKMTVLKLKYYFQEAKKYKDDIKADYNNVFDLTDVSFSIKDDDNKQKSKSRAVDSIVLESQRFLVSFIMSSVFSKTGRWATLKSNPDVLKAITGLDGEASKTIAEEIDKVLETNSETVYNTIDTTNYYTETSKAISDCVKVGTGIRKVIQLKSNAKPFTYAYQNLSNIYILEDTQGKPSIIFKVEIEKNLQDLYDMYGHIAGFQKPEELASEEELGEKISVIESVIGIYDENSSKIVYYHAVHTEDFNRCLVEETLEYNPYTVFRWSVDSSNPWGIGVGRANKALLQKLKENIEAREEHRDKIINPAVSVYGNKALAYQVNLRAGKINYMGSFNDANKIGIQPIQQGINLIPLDTDIEDCRNRIRSAYMAQPLGDVGDTRNRSATEMSLRHEMFRKEFSQTYELLNSELLEPTFMDAYYIMQSKGLLEEIENETYVTYSQIHYVNELTRSAGRDEIMNVLEAYRIASEVIPENQRQFVMDNGKFIELIREKMRIPLEVMANGEELNGRIAQQQELERIALLGRAQEDVGKKQDTGIPQVIQRGVETLDEY